MRIPDPAYTLHEVKDDHGLQYFRYYGRLASPFIGKPHVSIGRFAKT